MPWDAKELEIVIIVEFWVSNYAMCDHIASYIACVYCGEWTMYSMVAIGGAGCVN